MKTSWIRVSDICKSHQIEIRFIHELSENGLIELFVEEEEEFLEEEQLRPLEQFAAWHYDLDINLQGIEVARHLLTKIEYLQAEVERLRTDKHIR